MLMKFKKNRIQDQETLQMYVNWSLVPFHRAGTLVIWFCQRADEHRKISTLNIIITYINIAAAHPHRNFCEQLILISLFRIVNSSFHLNKTYHCLVQLITLTVDHQHVKVKVDKNPPHCQYIWLVSTVLKKQFENHHCNDLTIQQNDIDITKPLTRLNMHVAIIILIYTTQIQNRSLNPADRKRIYRLLLSFCKLIS